MTSVLHSLSHYNTITEPHAQFFLSLFKDLSIDFPFHFILSLIDVYKDMVTCDKLIFPLAITWLLRHFSVSYPESPYFTFMCAIDGATIKRSVAQFRSRQPRTETAAPQASTAPSSSAGGMTLKAIMAQLVRMDARLNTLSDKLCQVNTRGSHITR